MITSPQPQAGVVPPLSTAPTLEVVDLSAGYGPVQVLFGVSLEVREGEAVALLGPNGAGKSTLIRSIVGRLQPVGGQVLLQGQDITGMSPEQVVEHGVAHVAEERNIFPTLTVEENLRMGAHRRALGSEALEAEFERVYELFPQLTERRSQLAASLSGGEQQMLVIGRALMTDPALMLIDEASMGLAPNLTEELFDRIAELVAQGLRVLVVEQHVHLALRVATRGYVMSQGRIELEGSADELREGDAVQASYLGRGGSS